MKKVGSTHNNCNAVIGRVAFVVLCALAANTAGSTSVKVEVESFGPAQGWPGAVGAWVHYTHAMSVDCSPPPQCYAASQRIYYHAICSVGAIAVIQKVSMDLNGNIIAQTDFNVNARPYFPAVGSLDALAVRTICGGQFRYIPETNR